VLGFGRVKTAGGEVVLGDLEGRQAGNLFITDLGGERVRYR